MRPGHFANPGGPLLNLHLDANALIAIVHGASPELELLHSRLVSGAEPAVSSIAWFEFLCGPPLKPIAEQDIEMAGAFVGGRIVPVDSTTASFGARLFNQGSRRRGSQSDCLIAAAAMVHDAELFTLNATDFERFTPFGLRLAKG